MTGPGEYSLRELAADPRPRMLLFAELRERNDPSVPAEVVTILNTPALVVILKENGR